jgi:ribosomal protein S1
VRKSYEYKLESGIMEAEVNQIPENLEDLKRKTFFTGKVLKLTLAGAVVDIGMEAPGLIHISQIQKEPVNRVEDVLEVGQSVGVWVKRVFPKKKRIELTMIEPLVLEWREIKEGMVVKGTVTRLEKYGAFVEIGAERPGLVHISELAHGYIRTPNEAVSEGEEVEVKVLSVNRRRKQIKLGIKAMLADPAKIIKTVKEEEKQEDVKPVPTAMEIAMREAMERSQQDDVEEVKEEPIKEDETDDNEIDEILTRTLDQKVKTSAK